MEARLHQTLQERSLTSSSCSRILSFVLLLRRINEPSIIASSHNHGNNSQFSRTWKLCAALCRRHLLYPLGRFISILPIQFRLIFLVLGTPLLGFLAEGTLSSAWKSPQAREESSLTHGGRATAGRCCTVLTQFIVPVW